MMVAVGFNPRFADARVGCVAERRLNVPLEREAVFKRRSATRGCFGMAFRGLKPTATVMWSLRDRGLAPRRLNPFPRLYYSFRMANTYTSLHYHVIFSTKNREPLLHQDIEERV